MITSGPGLGFTINPIQHVKDSYNRVRHPVKFVKSSVKRTVNVVKHPIKTIKAAPKDLTTAVKTGVLKPVEWVAHTATRPLASRVRKLRDRRAAKLAWDRRKSRQPNAQERGEAKSWTVSKLRSTGPQGYLLALFAGPEVDQVMALGDVNAYGLGMEPATTSLIAASIPVFMALLNALLSKSAKSGEAPANPAVDAAADTMDAGAPVPGAVDMRPTQDAVAAVAAGQNPAEAGAMSPAAAGGGGGAAEDDGGGGGGGGAMAPSGLPGGMKKSTLLIGGGVVAAVLVVALLMKKR